MSEAHKALYWSAASDNAVRCGLCPHRCSISESASGICGVRENREGVLIASSYGQVSSIALDPIEKKPLYMFHPGKKILSIGGFGCSFRCGFCQNYEISLEYGGIRRQTGQMAPEDIAKLAVQTIPDGNIGVAYTYNEPFVGYEYVYDCASRVRGEGLYNVLVTNGYINKEPLEKLLPLIDAMNIDLKGFTDSFYKKLGGNLEAVKETIGISAKTCHVEVTTLVIPEENEDNIAKLAKWLSQINKDIPLHLTRFYPRYRYSGKPPTPVETINRLREVAGEYLTNVF